MKRVHASAAIALAAALGLLPGCQAIPPAVLSGVAGILTGVASATNADVNLVKAGADAYMTLRGTKPQVCTPAKPN